MSGLNFVRKTYTTTWVHCATVQPRDGGAVRVESYAYSRTVDFDWRHGPMAVRLRFTPAEARAVAAELLACAEAVDADSRGKVTARKGGAV